MNLREEKGASRLDLYFDTSSHGSHVAGIAAAHDMYGVTGFDGVALFFADVYRSAPFEKWATVPEAGGSGTHQGLGTGGDAESRGPEVAPGVTPAALALGARYLERVRDIPLLQKALDPSRQGEAGSNLWVADRKLSLNNRPILANDPHLGLDAPSTFYQMHFTVTRGNFDVVGNVFPGTPLVVHGQNLFCSWGPCRLS